MHQLPHASIQLLTSSGRGKCLAACRRAHSTGLGMSSELWSAFGSYCQQGTGVWLSASSMVCSVFIGALHLGSAPGQNREIGSPCGKGRGWEPKTQTSLGASSDCPALGEDCKLSRVLLK